MATYVPNANDTSEPTGGKFVSSAPAEFISIKEKFERTLLGPDGEILDELPPAASRMLKFLSFDSAGQPVVSVPTDGSAAALAAALSDGAAVGNGFSMVAYNPALAYASGGGEFFNRIYGRTAAEIAAAIVPSNYAFVPGDVRRYGAISGGVTDCSVAFQRAVDSLNSQPGNVLIPQGIWLITDTILVSHDRQHIRGIGVWSSRIIFTPTSSKPCIRLSAGAAVLYQGSVRDISFFSSDATFSKTAIENTDTSGYLLENIVVGGNVVAIPGSTFWSGATSIGLHFKGREALTCRNVFIYADVPIRCSDNPNHSIDMDHFHFSDTYLGAANNPNFVIDNGMNVTNLTIDGYNAWVLGTDGFYWVDTTTVGISQTVILRGIRMEQGQNTASWCVRIEHNSNLYGLSMEGCQGGLERNGICLRKVVGASIHNNINTGGVGRVALDVDNTVQGLYFDNNFWQALSTAVMTGQISIYETPKPASTAPLPPSALYQSDTIVDRRLTSQVALGGYQITLASGASVALGANTMAGMITIVDSEYLSAIFNVRGTNLAQTEVSDPSGVYSAVLGSGGTTNFGWNGGTSRYELQNNRPATRNYRIIFSGTYTSF